MISRKLSLFGVAAFAVGAAVTLAVPQSDGPGRGASSPAGNPTVGDFVQRYAATMGLAAQGGKPEDARSALRKEGVIGTDSLNLSSPLTEGDVVKLSGSHLKVSTTEPGRAFTQQRFDEFFSVFGPEIRHFPRRGTTSLARGSLPIPPDPSVFDVRDVPGKGGKGKGKGKGQSPSEP